MKNKPYYFLFVFVLFFSFNTYALADSPRITSFTLNGSSQNTTFNPQNGEPIIIEVKADRPVKFTRLYICSVTQPCNGTVGNYTRYFSQTNVSDTISKTWDGSISSSNKSFVPTGEYRIMASMKEGDNDPVTEFASYSIFVDFSANNGITGQNISTTSNEETNGSQAQNVTNTNSISTHSDPEDLSNYEKSQTFEVSAGRERVVYVGVPVDFVATKKISKGLDNGSVGLTWSFGDGFQTFGEKVSHTYKYPGEYNVVLNGEVGNEKAISRTKVRVLVPNVSVSISSSSDIEISNNGDTEINLGSWKLKGMSNEFIFPKDTILSSKGRIILSKTDIKIQSGDSNTVSLLNPSLGEVAKTDSQKDLISISSSNSGQITNEYEENVVKIEPKTEIIATNRAISSTTSSGGEKYNSQSRIIFPQDVQEENTGQTATVFNAVDTPTPSNGFLRGFFDLPSRGIKAIAKLFYDF